MVSYAVVGYVVVGYAVVGYVVVGYVMLWARQRMQMELHVANPIQMQPVIQAAQTQASTYIGSASTGNQLHR